MINAEQERRQEQLLKCLWTMAFLVLIVRIFLVI